MTPAEREQLLAELDRGEQSLAAAVKDFREEDASVRPAPDRWSALECLEHLVLAEEYLFSRVFAGQSNGSTMIGRDREGAVSAVALDRTRRIESPEMAKPRGRFATLAEALDGFRAARKTTRGFVDSCNEDLRAKFTTHPIVPSVNCWENLLMIAAHPRRHAEQIQETAEALKKRRGTAAEP
jgi:DinB family protein